MHASNANYFPFSHFFVSELTIGTKINFNLKIIGTKLAVTKMIFSPKFFCLIKEKKKRR